MKDRRRLEWWITTTPLSLFQAFWCAGLGLRSSSCGSNAPVWFWGAKQLFGTKIEDSLYGNALCRGKGLIVGNHLLLVSKREDTL